MRADLAGEVARDHLEAAQAVVPDADRPRPAGTAGEEPAEAEVVTHELDHAVAAVVAGDVATARVEPSAPVRVRSRVVAVGQHQHTAVRPTGEQAHDRL